LLKHENSNYNHGNEGEAKPSMRRGEAEHEAQLPFHKSINKFKIL